MQRVRAISERRRRRHPRYREVLEIVEGPNVVVVGLAVIAGVILLIWLGPLALAVLLGAIAPTTLRS